jgi:hypothetical protein
MAQTVGASLTVDRSPEARELSLALTKYLKKLNQLAIAAGSTVATVYDGDPACRVFLQSGTNPPSSNTSTESPGGDCCFIVDEENYDLYFISAWSAAGTFTATLVRNTVA